MACKERAAKVGGGVLGRVWALVAALVLLLGLAAFAPAPAQAASFKDVPSGQWYTSWVDKASDQGLMSGFTDPATGRPTGYFGPDEPLTRAQVATVLWRMAGGPSSGHASFPDVERGSWYDAPVAWCVKAGVVTGYTSGPDRGHFRPDRPVTRQELATMVYRYAKHAGMDVADPDPTAFRSTTDWRTVDSWASEALTWTAAAGVLSGVDNHDGTYSVVPFGTATRAMAAKVFVVLSGSPSAAKASYTVTFDSNGGSAVKAQAVRNGAKASKPASPTKSGYAFKGWYSDKSLTKAYDFNSTVKSNLTLYAKWEANKYTVTFVSNGGTSVAKQTVAYGSKTSKPSDPAKSGYVFKGWYTDKSLTKAYNFSSAVKSNLTLYAKWATESQPYAILCKDGLLSLQTGSDMDSSHGEVLGKWAWDGSSHPWYDQRDRVKSVVARDRMAVSNGSKMFSGLSNCTSMDLSRLDASHATSFSFMFQGCSSLTTVDVSGWDVSSAADFSSMFQFCSSLESLDLTGWNPSSATSLGRMFQNCSALASLDLSGWDVSSVADFGWMFANCKSLASFDVSGWDVSSAKDFAYMFAGCRSLESLDLSTWKTGALEGAASMFTACASLRSLDLSGWDVSNCASVDYMFSNCQSLAFLDLSGWRLADDASSAPGVSSKSAMFNKCAALSEFKLADSDIYTVSSILGVLDPAAREGLKALDVSNADLSGGTSLRGLFDQMKSLTSLDLSGWDVSGVRDFSQMFKGCSTLKFLDLSGWDVSSASDFNRMFQFCSSLESLDLTGWNPSSATRLDGMFQNCSALASLDLSGWDVSSVADFGWMFANCKSLASFDVSGWDVSSAKDFAYMFAGCRSLESLDLSTWKTGALEGAASMFGHCASLRSLDLSGWDVHQDEAGDAGGCG